jgi:hypothetical protein
VAEEPFPTDGWSGATFSLLRRSEQERFVLKRDSLAADWIARATRDDALREAMVVAAVTSSGWSHPPLSGPIVFPYLGSAADDGGSAILMPDLSTELIAWERPAHEAPLDVSVADRVLDAVARLHTLGWWVPRTGQDELPWCHLPERLTLLTRRSAEGYAVDGNPVGERFLAGWDAFDCLAPAAARELVATLAEDPLPLLEALSRLPSIGLHGDLKLANVAVWEGSVGFIDWQLVTFAPVAVELGWLLVSNSAVLPFEPQDALRRYRESLRWHVGRWGVGSFHPGNLEDVVGDWESQLDLAMIVGLLLRGWRKGLDAEAGTTLASGVSATDDLAWWCARAVEGAARRLP